MDPKTIIIFPGTADALFFQMELPAIKQRFNRIIVVSYPIDQAVAERLMKQWGITILVLPKLPLRPVGLAKWLREPAVRSERQRLQGSAYQKLKKSFYMGTYGATYLAAKKLLEPYLTDGHDYVVYAYWLARTAYAGARLKADYPDRIRLAVSRAHGYDLYIERSGIDYLPFRTYLDQALDEIWFISNQGRSYFDSIVPETDQSAKRELAYLGTKTDLTLEDHQPKLDIPVIASCSRIDQNKRLDLIIDVLSQLEQPFSWLHVGGGGLQDSIEQLAKAKLPAESYRFVGNVSNEEILEVYRQAGVTFFINLSDSEGLPVSIMEASSLGIPSIARQVGGVGEIVTSETGCLLTQTLPQELPAMRQQVRQFVSDMLANPEIYQAKRRAARQLWCQHFQAEDNFDRLFAHLAGD